MKKDIIALLKEPEPSSIYTKRAMTSYIDEKIKERVARQVNKKAIL